MVDLNLVTVGGEKRRYKYPLGPNGRLSAATSHLTRGTAALKVRHYRTCQDSKGQDLNSKLSWLWLEDVLVGIVSTWLHIKACALIPLYSTSFPKLNSKYKRIQMPLSRLPLSFVIGVSTIVYIILFLNITSIKPV
jgi:hypothetical protein